eukprot:gene5939-biopygen7262
MTSQKKPPGSKRVMLRRSNRDSSGYSGPICTPGGVGRHCGGSVDAGSKRGRRIRRVQILKNPHPQGRFKAKVGASASVGRRIQTVYPAIYPT